ncbi:uncharacterized protein LOC125025885 isoform X1 [Penaeus chinensis]|uniref:uncharacterized protein LOC125025885 isoform X1 n=1 Tax=Penaeus chinensis TaxID=139456 RepID=UPI001FB5FAF0|nr:uncharacterized protein LOC125025885 isoform X1 [Penaeus chinensis]
MQVSGRAKVVLVTVLFCLFWSGFLAFAVRSLVSGLVARLGAVESLVSGEDPATDGVLGAVEKAVRQDTEVVSNKLGEMISKMERLVEDTDLSVMNNEEMMITFGKLYDLFPMMDNLFERLLKAEVVQAVNPRGDFYEMQRRYDALRETLELKRKEKEEL